MSRRIIIWALCVVMPLVADWVSFDGTPIPTPPTISIQQNDAQAVILNIKVHGIMVIDTMVDGITYQRIKIPDETRTSDIGKAELPIINRIIQIQPMSGVTLCDTTIKDTLLDNYNIFPRQPGATDSGPIPPFEKDTAFYNSYLWYPSDVVLNSGPCIFKDIRIISLFTQPISANPLLQQIKIKTELNVTVNFEGIDPENALLNPPTISDHDLDLLYDFSVLNYDLQVDTVIPPGGLEGTWYNNYIILTADEFFYEIQPLVFWKTKKGCNVTVKKLSEIPGYSGTPADTSIIREYLHDICEQYPPGSWINVLLVGDEEAIPPHNAYPHPIIYYIHSDHYYACLFGDDEIEDIFLGRLCVTTNEQVANLIHKISSYERNPKSSWNKTKVLLVATWNYNHTTWYQENKIEIREDCFSVDPPPYHEHYGDIDVGTMRMQLNTIGIGLVNYRGHGGTAIWFNQPDPPDIGWTTYDIHNQLSNTDKYPLVLNVTCSNGQIQSDIECMVEAWTNSSKKGAVGALGATRPCETNYAFDLDKEIFYYLYHHMAEYAQSYPIGGAILTGRNKLIADGSTWAVANARMYLWIGDPDLTCWRTEWGNLQVSHPASILWKQPQTITVNVKRWDGLQNWIPVKGARVCLYKSDEDIHKNILTDNDGNATTTITTQYTGDIFVTVTYSNCHPYEGICRVKTTVANPPSFRDSEIQLETRLNYIVSGDGNVLINYQVSETNSHLRMIVYDVLGRKVGTMLNGTYEPGVHCLKWNKYDNNKRRISSGVYFCELQALKTKTRWVKKFFVP